MTTAHKAPRASTESATRSFHSAIADEEKASHLTDATSEPPSEPSNPADLDAAPEGGVRAWLVAAGGASLFFCCLGFSNSFGAFEEFYLTHQLRNETPDRVAWIGSISAFLQFATGMLGGPLFDLYGSWVREGLTTAVLCLDHADPEYRSFVQPQYSTSSP